jgi:hypothetical protein
MNRREFTIIAKEAVREVVAKSRPNTLFEQAFFDLREKAKGIKTGWEEEAKTKLQAQVVKDLRSKGVTVMDAKLSLGRYRGSSFVTSFKLKVRAKNEAEAEKMAEYLRGKYSPKWKVKKFEDGVADLNVR